MRESQTNRRCVNTSPSLHLHLQSAILEKEMSINMPTTCKNE